MGKLSLSELLETIECRYGLMSYFKSDQVIGVSLRKYGEWAQNEIDFLLKFIEPGDTVFDIGAFIGTHTLAFAKQVGRDGCVYAIEPNPMTFEVLAQNVRQNGLGNVKLENVALSNQKSVFHFEESDCDLSNPGGTSLLERESKNSHPLGSYTPIPIRCLDEYQVEKCRLIKIDVEQMEANVLAGALQFINQHRPYVYAECLSIENGAQILSLMKSVGYIGFLHVENAFSPANFRKNTDNIYGLSREANFILVPTEDEGNFRKWPGKFYGLALIDSIDDLVLGMLKKPQYKQEILSKTNTAKVFGVEFWLNEPEQKQLGDQVSEKTHMVESLAQQVNEKEQLIQAINSQLAEREQVAQEMQALLSEKEQVLQDLNVKISEYNKEKLKLDAELSQKTQILQTLFSRLLKKQDEIAKQEGEKNALTEQLSTSKSEAARFSAQLWEIKQSRAWSIVQILWKFRLRFFPSGSIQSRLARSTFHGLRVIKNKGIIVFIKSLGPRRSLSSTVSVLASPGVSSNNTLQKISPPSLVNPDPVYVPDTMNQRTQREIVSPDQKTQLDDPADMWEKVTSCLKHNAFSISISHDDYLAINFGGIQMFMADEQAQYAERDISYLHIYPLNEADYLASDGLTVLGLNVDSTHIGHYSVDAVAKTLERLLTEKYKCASLVVHHFKGWTLTALQSVLSAAHPTHYLFYTHDFYSLCPQYVLLRNQREYCYAPSLDSDACTICEFSEKRKIHLPQVRALFTSYPFLIISPSETAKGLWRKVFVEIGRDIQVIPHLSIKEASASLPVRNYEQINIAYAGQGVLQKGWEYWRKAVSQFSSYPDYKLFHLGSWAGEYPETFENVRVSAKNRTAMLEAIRKHQIDVLFQCSISPETFSFVLYEAISAGCFVLTLDRSGNIADYVNENKNGRVFASYNELSDYLSAPSTLRDDLLEFRKRYPRGYILERNNTIVNMVDTSLHAGGSK